MSSNLTGISAVAERYATALFELSVDNRALDEVDGDLNQLAAMITESEDLRRVLESPVISRDDQTKAVDAIAEKAGFTETVRNFLGVVAGNHRLFALDDMIRAWRALLADHRGEITADVITATALNDSQRKAVETALKEATGSQVLINEEIDASLIGGMIVRVGSRMVDSSLKTKLQRLQLVMKGAA